MSNESTGWGLPPVPPEAREHEPEPELTPEEHRLREQQRLATEALADGAQALGDAATSVTPPASPPLTPDAARAALVAEAQRFVNVCGEAVEAGVHPVEVMQIAMAAIQGMAG